jgi:rifampicin phosphotransferase
MGPAVANTLLSGIGHMQSADAGLAMWDLAAWADTRPELREILLRDLPWAETRQALAGVGRPGREYLSRWDTFMAEHGHHARGEIDLMTPRWNEQPDYVLVMVRAYLAAAEQVDPPAVRRRRSHERDRLAANSRRSLRNPLTRVAFDFLLRQAQGAARMRENGKSEAVRRLAVLRWAALELGHRLADRGLLAAPEDVFFLTVDEIPPARAVPPDLDARAVVLERRAQRERDLALDPPPVVVGRFDPTRAGTAPGPLQGLVFTGLAACSGIARGRARVIPDLASDAQVLPGEILVAPYTDPGWTPYFLPAAGIVVDMGGLLSHGSICAREYGIPAVVNVGPASKTIRTGQMVEVDGDRGVVRMLDKPIA